MTEKTTSGFDFFWSIPGRLAISNIKEKYLNKNCSQTERQVAAAFKRSENLQWDKLIRAIKAEQGIASTGSNKLDPIENIMIKPVSDICNLACTYCYEGEGSDRYSNALMKEETLERITEQAFKNANSHLTFLWHGGEPTLAGIIFFKKAVEFQKKLNAHNILVSNVIQTNGVNLNKEWIDFYKKNNFFVGFSLDGTKDINDRQRIDHKGNGSFENVMRSLKLMQSEGMDFGIITVINDLHKGRAKEIFDFYMSHGILNFDIHPGYGNTYQISPADYSEFVIDMFDQWINSNREDVHISIFEEIFKVMNGDRPSTCYFAGTCSKVFAIESNGNIVPCTRPFDRLQYTFGNINNDPLDDILNGKKHHYFKNEDQVSQEKSKTCPWYFMCHNGCPQHRTKDGRADVTGANLFCKCQSNQEGGNYAIWEHITSQVFDVLKKNTPS